jgi:hypothetical protein
LVLTPNALKLIEEAKEYELKNNGRSAIDLNSDLYNSVKYGEIMWKENREEKDKLPNNTFYIKPSMGDVDWRKKNLPEYFNDEKKIKNSDHLYSKW